MLFVKATQIVTSRVISAVDSEKNYQTYYCNLVNMKNNS